MEIDHDVHGIAGVRLVDPAPRDMAAVAEVLGPPAPPLSREPDMLVRYVDRLPLRGPLRALGAGAAFADEGFVLVRRGERHRAVVRLPLEEVGMRPCEILCERRLGRLPLLVDLLNLTMLGKGWLPVHASAFVLDGLGTMTAGWPGGGKTGALLAFMAHGAHYVADDWVYVGGQPPEMRGLAGVVEVKAGYADQQPRWRERAGRRPGRAVRAARRAAGLLEAAPGHAGRGAARVRSGLAHRERLRATPQALFGAEACALGGRLDRVVVAVTHDAPDVEVRSLPRDELARRVGAMLDYEWQRLASRYAQFRFAFPDRTNPLLEDRAARQGAALGRLASIGDGLLVSHPSPAPIERLFERLRPCLAG